MRSRANETGRDHGSQDDLTLGIGSSPARKRLAEQVAILVRALQSTDEGVQGLAVVQLTLLGPKVVPHLASALEDALDESDLRQLSHESSSSAEREIAGICSALGIIADHDSMVDLAAALPRREAVEALAKIGGDRALELIMGTIEEKAEEGGPLGRHSVEADPEFVRRVFLLLGEAGRRRLKEELDKGAGTKREAVAEIVRIMGYSD